jgi:hypothetical protein
LNRKDRRHGGLFFVKKEDKKLALSKNEGNICIEIRAL